MNQLPDDWKKDVAADTSSVSRFGYMATGLTLGVFLIWATTVPISSAVVATGKVVSTGQNKLLQHPAGGVIKQIIAREGDSLEQGDLVASVEPASAIAELADLTAARNLAEAKRLRLQAAKAGALTYSRPKPVKLAMSQLRGTNSAIDADSQIFDEQEAEFNASRQRFKSELSVLQNQLTTLEGEYYNTRKQVEQERARLSLLNKQYDQMKPLAEDGHIAKIRLWDVDSSRLQARVQVTQLDGQLDSLIGRMDEVEDQIAAMSATREQENSRELSDVLSELASIEDKIKAARKLVEYSEIRAPVSGTLTNITVHTIGGVIGPGDPIAEIVPAGQPLQIEARVLPADIGSITTGQPAEVIITAFNRHLDDPLEAEISYVAADSMLDEATQEPYFLVRLDIAPEENVAKRITPGMFTEIFVQTEARSFMSYALKPVTDSFRKAFKEQ